MKTPVQVATLKNITLQVEIHFM